jgi:hypothetical protein
MSKKECIALSNDFIQRIQKMTSTFQTMFEDEIIMTNERTLDLALQMLEMYPEDQLDRVANMWTVMDWRIEYIDAGLVEPDEDEV